MLVTKKEKMKVNIRTFVTCTIWSVYERIAVHNSPSKSPKQHGNGANERKNIVCALGSKTHVTKTFFFFRFLGERHVCLYLTLRPSLPFSKKKNCFFRVRCSCFFLSHFQFYFEWYVSMCFSCTHSLRLLKLNNQRKHKLNNQRGTNLIINVNNVKLHRKRLNPILECSAYSILISLTKCNIKAHKTEIR